MNTIRFKDNNTVKMIAHRGVSGLERENTCPAFVAAGVKTYYGIETDVHVTGDGNYVVYHDDNLVRLLGSELVIRQTDLATLRQFTLLDTDEKTKRSDLMIPTLDDYLCICKKYEKVAVLELKEEMTKEQVKGIANAVRDMDMIPNTVFISFHKQNLLYLREAYPDATAQFLTTALTDETIEFMLDNNFDADILHDKITKEFVDLMHRHGRVVNAWTADTLEDAQRLAAYGVDMITTNILE